MAAQDAPVSHRQTLLQAIARLCVDHGLTDFIVAPGSRSAPLSIALARQPGLRCRVVYDERAAGHLALGLAQQSGRPVGLVCTSGTAALNLAPALAEAFYQQVPLLALTADRPPEWIDQQDNQAIHQRGLYEPHVRASYELPVDYGHPDAAWHALRTMHEAIQRATAPLPGPVHVNVPLREPLYPATPQTAASIVRLPGPWLSRKALPARPQLTGPAWEELLATWRSTTRKLIIAGLHPRCDPLRRALGELSARPDVAVIADVTANLFPDGTPLHHGDAILGVQDPAALRDLQPELVISFGGPATSKYLKQFLRGLPPHAHWRVQPAGDAPDTYQTLTHLLPMWPDDFFAELARRVAPLPQPGDYAAHWLRLETSAGQLLERFLAQADFGEFQAIWRVLQALPAGSRLQIGSSMPVRYANLIGHASPGALLSVHSNRGVSGIDGAVSTAVGAALAGEGLTTLIVGDLSFFYDRNGLWHAHVPPNLRIVLLNNHGGGIFDIIDGPDRLPPDLRRTYFLTPQPLTAQRTAADHGLDYLHAADAPSLDAALASFFTARPRAALLEIESAMAVNSQVFRQFKALLAQLA